MPSEQPATLPAAVAAARGKLARPTPELAEAMARGYEPKDVGLKGLFIFLGTLVVVLCVVLLAIYKIMMFLVDDDRTHDPLGSPVAAINKTEQYAPLQPSVGHNTDDWEDMELTRQQAQLTLNSSGTSPTGRKFIPIAQAMDLVLPHLRTELASAHPIGEWPASPKVGGEEGSRIDLVDGRPVPVLDAK